MKSPPYLGTQGEYPPMLAAAPDSARNCNCGSQSPLPEKHSLTEVGPRPTPTSQIGMPLQDMTDYGNHTAEVTNSVQGGGENPGVNSRKKLHL